MSWAGYAVGDDADQAQSRIRSLHQRIRRIRRRNEGQARLGAGGIHRFLHGVEDRPIEVPLAAFSRGHAPDHVGAVSDHFLGVKRRLVAGEALQDHARGFVDQNAHRGTSPREAATAFSAASAKVSAEMMGRPQPAMMRLPSSTLVPARRTTSGTRKPWAACTTPCATQSQRLMPAKMLTRIDLDVLVGEHQIERRRHALG